jgi:hypothetical protein
MNSTATAVAFRRSGGPRVVSEPRISAAALQAELVRGAMVRNTQSISPMPDPLPPANPLGLVSLAAIGLVVALGELVKRFSQLWGSNNSRAESKGLWQRYSYYRINGAGLSGWLSTSATYPVAITFGDLIPDRTAWPGKIEYRIKPPSTGKDGQLYKIGLVWYPKKLESVEVGEVSGTWESGLVLPDRPFVGKAISYEFSNSNEGNEVLKSWAGNSNIPAEPQDNPYTQDTIPLVPITGLSPLDRLPPVPATAAPVAQKAPLQQAQSPTAAAVPVVPVVPASPSLVAAWKIISTKFYRPDRLPTLPRPATTATRSTTGAGTLVAPAVLPVPQTATDLRMYGSQVITAIGVRPDLAAIAEEVGRLERKTGIMLDGMDKTPDWFEGLLGPLLNQLKESLLDALVVDVPSTTYQFSAPCDYDINGNRLVLNKQIAEADFEPAIVARLDAIADAIKVLKWWKTPTCRVSPPPQSNVTVTAQEFDPD